VSLLREQLKVYSNQDRLSSSRSRTPNAYTHQPKKSVSPHISTNIRPSHTKRPTYPQAMNKPKSICKIKIGWCNLN